MTDQQIHMQQVQNLLSQLTAPPQEEPPRTDGIIRVAATSPQHKVAGSIARKVRQERRAEVQAIGLEAINQMVKSIVIARSYLEEDKLDLVMVPSFVEVLIKNETRTALRLSVWVCDCTCSR
jgi:stage V sporulation protein S